MVKKRPASIPLRLSEDAWNAIRNAIARDSRNRPFADLRIALTYLQPLIEAIIALPKEQLRILNQHHSGARLEMFLHNAISNLPPPLPSPRSALMDIDLDDLPTEDGIGGGMGERVSYDEGRRLLQEFAVAVDLEESVGPLTDALGIERQLGIPLSTLEVWHAQKLVVGFQNDQQKCLYPMAQFLEGKPIDGIRDVQLFIPYPYTAWTRLISPKPSIGGAPLELLKQGRFYDVLAAVERDFGND